MILLSARPNQSDRVKGTDCLLCNNRRNKCWQCKRKWGQVALYLSWKGFIISSCRCLIPCKLLVCGIFGSLRLGRQSHCLQCAHKQGFRKTILLGGSKYENRKKQQTDGCQEDYAKKWTQGLLLTSILMDRWNLGCQERDVTFVCPSDREITQSRANDKRPHLNYTLSV